MNSNPHFATRQGEARFISNAVTAIDSEQAWRQVLDRDSSAKFFYAVSTTGVFCRPDCKSRRPLRTNVRFFPSIEEAGRAGFRPCQRCRPAAARGNSMQAVRAHIERNLNRRVSLAELAQGAEMSPFTVQRQFKRTMGVSPLEYQRALRASKLRSELKNGETVTDSIYSAGFSSASRAYEGAQLGMTPSSFAAGGRGELIAWASAPSPYGWVIAGATERGLCWLALADTKDGAEATLRTEFPAAMMREDHSLEGMVKAALSEVERSGELLAPVRLDLRGTAFQLKVWQALRTIPRGETRSYSQLAGEMGDPKATRAVARACATNRVALVVPCHRVVGMSGSLTGYRWGVERKRRLLEAERRVV